MDLIEKQKLSRRMQFIVQMQSDMENPALDATGRARAAEQLRELGQPVGATRQPDPMGGPLQLWEWREAREIRHQIVLQRNEARAREQPPRPPLAFPIDDPWERQQHPPETRWEASLRA